MEGSVPGTIVSHTWLYTTRGYPISQPAKGMKGHVRPKLDGGGALSTRPANEIIYKVNVDK